MVTVIVAEVSPNLLSLTRHAGLILAGIPVEESESESQSKKYIWIKFLRTLFFSL